MEKRIIKISEDTQIICPNCGWQGEEDELIEVHFPLAFDGFTHTIKEAKYNCCPECEEEITED